MQKRHCKTGLIRIFLALAVLDTATAHARLQLKKYTRKIENQPVEVFVAQDDGQMPRASWQALPLTESYPAGGMSVPELASSAGATTAVNANFYREDHPGFQEPIGLVVHQGRLLSAPHKYFPSIAVIDGALEWDNVTWNSEIEIETLKGQVLRERLCKLNSEASKGCSTLWMNRVPQNLTNAIYVKPPAKLGLALGEEKFSIADNWSPEVWAVQSKLVARAKKLRIITSLSGQRLGARWLKVTEAVSGSHLFTKNGKLNPPNERLWMKSRQPRTFAGVDAQGHGWVAVFDGRREQSHGISLRNAWNFAHSQLHAQWALNFDGGGSSTLLFRKNLSNHPSDSYPRPVAVGWGSP